MTGKIDSQQLQTDLEAVPEIGAMTPDEVQQMTIPEEEFEKQVALERWMLDHGKAQFETWAQKQMDEGFTERTPGGREVARQFMGPIAYAISRFQAGEAGLLAPLTEKVLAGKSRKGPLTGADFRPLIQDMDPIGVAAIAVRTILRACMKGDVGISVVRNAMVDDLERDAKISKLKKAEPHLAKRVEQDVVRFREKGWRADTRRWTALENAVGEWAPWPTKLKMKLVDTLVHLIHEHSGLIKMETIATSNRREIYVSVTEKCIELLKNSNARAALLSPTVLPWRVEPRDWRDPRSGVWWNAEAPKDKLVRARRRKHLDQLYEATRDGSMDEVYDAVNTAQKTQWALNQRVWQAMVDLEKMEQAVGEHMQPEVMLPEPALLEEGASEEAWKVRNQETAIIKAKNRVTGSKHVAWKAVTSTVEKVIEFGYQDRFHFTYQLDFRGRMYPMQTGWTPQGTDPQKALLQFTKGVELGEAGAYWLAIHGANCWGEKPEDNWDGPKLDKLSYADRVKWVEGNEKRIRYTAESPLTCTWWRKAADPWCFLAFCIEWTRMLDWAGTADPIRGRKTFVSHLPVAMDGTCNGLQHLAAMSRDPLGAQEVNLVPMETPADVYQKVADGAMETLRTEVQSGHEFARGAGDMLEFGIDRKITKRTVMIIPYGGSMMTCLGHIREELNSKAKKVGWAPWLDEDGTVNQNRIEETRTHAEHTVWDAVLSSLGRGMEVMGWMQKCASAMGKAELPVYWTTPVGFPAYQEYRKQKGERLDIGTGDARQTIQLRFDTDKLDRGKQRDAIAPNVVHSFDAAHMMRTITLCVEDCEIEDFALIHDSFGTHAGEVENLQTAIRRAFVMIYAEPVLSGLRSEWADQVEEAGVDVTLPMQPRLGSWDPETTLDADYFFS